MTTANAMPKLATLSNDEIRDLMGEVRVAFAQAHARSAKLRKQIQELNDQLERSTRQERDCLGALDDLANCLTD
ncbi:hypothetical protein [Rhodococcus pyridinivorans]|uniref:hypothetical protein n=1 Tax=Rhodococcus pyridinivorans TaxID=103816 RepID=UPI003AAF6897